MKQSTITYNKDNLTITIEGMDEVEKALEDLKRKTPAAAKVAINATAREARKLMIAQAKARYAVNAKGAQHLKDLKTSGKKGHNATNTNLEAVLFIAKPRADLAYFQHRPTQSFSGRAVLHNAPEYVQARILKSSSMRKLGAEDIEVRGRSIGPGSKGFLLTFLVTQMLPASLMLTPMYLIFNKLHLLGTYLGPALAISSGSVPFIVVTLRPYFKSVPTALDDAARIDGCGVLRSFFKIMIPAIKTGIITVVVISFLNGWNDLAYSMTFNVKPEMRPLTANIYKFQSKWGTKWNCIMAYGTILVLPVILLFVFLQKYIVGGLTAGAVKE